jgi:flagellar hook protein FlgE
LVHSGVPGESFTDNRLEEDITDLTNSANRKLNLDGPPIDSGTLLSEIVVRDGNNYIPAFELGEFSLTFRKGGDTGKSYTQKMDITATTRVNDLLVFMEQATGIARSNSSNELPSSLNKIPGETGMLPAGVSLIDGAIRVVSNNGAINGVTIPTSGLKVTNNGGVMNPALSFSRLQSGNGTTAATEFLAYDTLGIPLQVRVSVVMESQDQNSTVYRWYAESPDNDPVEGFNTHAGTGRIELDGEGRLKQVSNSTVSIGRANSPADHPLTFELNWDIVSGLASDRATVTAASQDGAGAGTLSSFTINRDGSITGVFSNGSLRPLGQIMLGVFSNQGGLIQRGENMYANGLNAGLALRKPGDGSGGELIAGALELSNVDIGRNLIDLGLASTLYRGNSRVISTTQQLLDELLNLRR